MDVVTAIASFFADLMPYLAGWRAAKIVHAFLLNNVLKTPLQFFEVTPQGRILSRFSKDMDVLDTSLPSQFADVIYCLFEVISAEEIKPFFTFYFFVTLMGFSVVYVFVCNFTLFSYKSV